MYSSNLKIFWTLILTILICWKGDLDVISIRHLLFHCKCCARTTCYVVSFIGIVINPFNCSAHHQNRAIGARNRWMIAKYFFSQICLRVPEAFSKGATFQKLRRSRRVVHTLMAHSPSPDWFHFILSMWKEMRYCCQIAQVDFLDLVVESGKWYINQFYNPWFQKAINYMVTCMETTIIM